MNQNKFCSLLEKRKNRCLQYQRTAIPIKKMIMMMIIYEYNSTILQSKSKFTINLLNMILNSRKEINRNFHCLSSIEQF